MKFYSVLFFAIIFLTLNLTPSRGQTYTEQPREIDVLHYALSIRVNDSTDVIMANANVQLHFLEATDQFTLDLVSQNEEGKGMRVDGVRMGNKDLEFSQNDDVLKIRSRASAGDTLRYQISYSGIPKDGLVISTNKFGDRTFFGDNWPNRAHNWFPSVDHPSDKAFYTFTIDAPDHYQVVANGILKEEINLSDDYTRYIWETTVPLPSKVAVIGIARFAVQNVTELNGIDISTWVYPQNADAGFYDYQPAASILDFYINYIGPYPYQKLANVQSKTRFGGMENAGNIFYFENSVTGKQEYNSLLAHEIVHQWFGNSASETDWAHLWLSEGFATYLTNIYIEQTEGEEASKELLRTQRHEIIEFFKKNPSPVVNTGVTNYMRLLNANSYQKGGWFLHMLRYRIGDERFQEVIRSYYETYKLSNASTEDFRAVAESVNGEELNSFFDQWLYKTGQPELKITHATMGKKVIVTIQQMQKTKTVFKFPLELDFHFTDESSNREIVQISHLKEQFEFKFDDVITDILPDPEVKLLFEWVK